MNGVVNPDVYVDILRKSLPFSKDQGTQSDTKLGDIEVLEQIIRIFKEEDPDSKEPNDPNLIDIVYYASDSGDIDVWYIGRKKLSISDQALIRGALQAKIGRHIDLYFQDIESLKAGKFANNRGGDSPNPIAGLLMLKRLNFKKISREILVEIIANINFDNQGISAWIEQNIQELNTACRNKKYGSMFKYTVRALLGMYVKSMDNDKVLGYLEGVFQKKSYQMDQDILDRILKDKNDWENAFKDSTDNNKEIDFEKLINLLKILQIFRSDRIVDPEIKKVLDKAISNNSDILAPIKDLIESQTHN